MAAHEAPVSVREAEGDIGTEEFWRRLLQYFAADILPDPDDALRARFLGREYRDQIQRVHDRPADRARYLLFVQDGRDVGLALAVVFDSEDGKCLIMEFCVYPEFWGGGLGHRCARALLDWARLNGAAYAELNYGGDERRLRFWKSLGFVSNGADQWGDPTLIPLPGTMFPSRWSPSPTLRTTGRS